MYDIFMHLNPFVKERYRTVDWFNRRVDVTDAACVADLVHVQRHLSSGLQQCELLSINDQMNSHQHGCYLF